VLKRLSPRLGPTGCTNYDCLPPHEVCIFASLSSVIVTFAQASTLSGGGGIVFCLSEQDNPRLLRTRDVSIGFAKAQVLH
jgi:hypothetical protein